ncbi:hypothetical protein D3C78_1506250 [compost metagenome]
MPSFWSAVAKSDWKERLSNLRPSESGTSKERLTLSLAMSTEARDREAMRVAASTASSIRFAAGTTRDTRPARSASAASIMRPVRTRSMAFALPTARVSRCEPPMPGMTPRVISGWPNFAVSEAMIKSHIIASSQPPPSAKPETAAITGLRVAATSSQPPRKSPT